MHVTRPRWRLSLLDATSILLLLAVAILTTGCGRSPDVGLSSGAADGDPLTAVAVTTFLADIARNVAGDKMEVESLVPAGVDPHAFQVTPRDAVQVAGCDVLILNGAGLDSFLEETFANIGEDVLVIEASAGLVSRVAREGEEAHEAGADSEEDGEHHHHDEGDPHFWLDPNLVVKYVENIRDGLSEADPANASTYEANAAAYIGSLGEVDAWIDQQVDQIPPAERLLVTDHESLGYFADRYGFQVVGTIMPSVSADVAPSAQQVTRLVGHIRETGVRAIFLETGANPQLAQQLASEAGIKVVTGLYSHSLTDADGPAPTYIDMIKANTRAIVEALK